MLYPFDHDLFRDRLLDWFAVYQRDLPWRQTYDPYHVWVAEIMGQQTQLERAAGYFLRWIDRFPDIRAVADAPEQEILKAWEGLGYYRRARNLQRAARKLLADHSGKIPADYRSLLALPGIGPYTASAIVSIAFNESRPVLDANVSRVLARVADIDQPVRYSVVQKALDRLLWELVPADGGRDFNQALMELGALVCTPAKPDCPQCPISEVCRARRVDSVDLRPVTGRKAGRIRIEMACGIIIREGRIFIQQRLDDDVWGGLWEFPGGRLEDGEAPEAAVRREILEETELQVASLLHLATVQHAFTRYQVTLHGFLCQLTSSAATPVLHAAQEFSWVRPAELGRYAFPAGHRKLIVLLEERKWNRDFFSKNPKNR
ncbi:A/G-specific adenine glycosylase [Desulfolithobacter sp.]